MNQKHKTIPFHQFIGIVHVPPCPNGCGNLVTEVRKKVVAKQPVDFDTPIDKVNDKQKVTEATCQYLCQHCHETFYIKVQFTEEAKLVA